LRGEGRVGEKGSEMPRPPSRYPTELELEILKILWRDGPCSVRQVRDALVDFRELAYTSVMTIMTIMTRKGYLKRSRKGKSYRYTPLATEEETARGIVGDLVDRVFDGSAAAAVIQLLDTTDIDEVELAELRELINRKVNEGEES
jgi:BlaI family penicillinase repressor